MNYKALTCFALVAAISACGEGSPVGQEGLSTASEPYVLRRNEGEEIHDPQGRTTYIKVSPQTGSRAVALSTQELPPGTTIRVHRHDRTEEILYVTEGEGTLILGDQRLELEPDMTVWVPPGTWHGVEEITSHAHILGFVTPPGLENFFRRMFWHAGEQPKELSAEEIAEIEQLHDAVLQPPPSQD